MKVEIDIEAVTAIQEMLDGSQIQSTNATAKSILSKLTPEQLDALKKIRVDMRPACFCNKAK